MESNDSTISNKIISFDDYRDALKFIIQAKSFKQSTLCSKLSLEKSFFSKVLSKKSDLTLDTLFRVLLELGISNDNREYVILLHELNRTGVPERALFLKEELLAKKQVITDLQNHLAGIIDKKDQYKNRYDYYTCSATFLLHMVLICNPRILDGSDQKVLKLLQISKSKLINSLNTLQKLNIIAYEDKRIILTERVLHLPADSSLNFALFQTMRGYTSHLYTKSTPQDQLKKHLTVSLSISENDYHWLFGEINELIKRAQNRTINSIPEVVAQFNLDLFKVFEKDSMI